MSQMLARVNCPSCGQPFGTPVEQIIDVEVDPTAKGRLLSGQTNVAVCPHCGMAGGLSLPFIYHDPANEVALVFMPMEAGRSEAERQRVIGSLSRSLMNQLPPEQRKGYLLNPPVFFSLESLIEKVLEIEGVTEEMLAAQRAKFELLQSLLDAPPENRAAIVRENEDMIDEEFFQILHANLSQVEAMGLEPLFQSLLGVQEILFEETALGRRMAKRSAALRALQDESTRDKLVELLIEAEDEETRELLISFAQPLIDYFFFQKLTQRVDAAEEEAERNRLERIRQEVMDVREALREQAQQVVAEKEALLRDLLMSENPELLARRRLASMDELFFNLLANELEEAKKANEKQAAEKLEGIWNLAMGLVQEMVPPEIRLLETIMGAEDDASLRSVLEQNGKLVGPPLVGLLEEVIQQFQERGEDEGVARATRALNMVQGMLGMDAAPAPTPQEPAEKEPQPPAEPQAPTPPGEERRPSGLLIAKK
jgi:hypothetical protein